MRRTGFGTDYDYDDLPDEQKTFSDDGTRAAAFWVARQRSDLHDDDTVYYIAVWDAATGERLESYTCVHNIGAGGEVGRRVRAVRFDAAGALEIVYDDGSAEAARKPDPGPPPWERRREASEPDPPLFDPSR